MRRFLLLSLGLLVAVVLACDETFITPTAPSRPPTTTSVLLPPPRVDGPFDWDHFQGFTAFALGHPGQDEVDITGLYREAMSHGWNTGRICAETENWEGDDRYPQKPRDPERLRWTLDIIARIPGAQVLLIGDCTLKGPVPELEKRAWAEQVAQVARDFKNVAVETHNEFDNCSGRGWGPYCPGKQDVAEHVRIYRGAGIQYVTADDSICYGPIYEPKTYQFRLANIGAMPADFHPCRTAPVVGSHGSRPWDPSLNFLKRLQSYNGTFVLSETVAWMDYSGTCDDLRTCDQDRINRFIADCAAVQGCRFTFHSENLLAGLPPSWWPAAQ